MLADHDALLRDWKRNAARREDVNYRFVRSLKMVDDPNEVDELARRLHQEVFARIDCTRCASCCKTMTVGLNDQDIERIAGRQEMTREEFIAAFLTVDPDNLRQFLIKTTPCPFLGEDDRCTIYDVRPESCRDFPHTDKEGFACRTHLHASNTLTCPAVYHIVEEMRKAL